MSYHPNMKICLTVFAVFVLSPCLRGEPLEAPLSGPTTPTLPPRCIAADAPLPDLAAFYDFNDFRSSEVVRDKSGGGVDLVPGRGGIITATDGVFGNGVRFDGGAVLMAKCNPLAHAAKFSVSLWFKCPDPTANLKFVGAARWAGGNDASGWVLGSHYPEVWADEKAGSLRMDDGWKRSVAFLPNQWNHLVLTYDGGRLREYINGQLAAESPGSERPAGVGVPMTVGGWMTGFNFHGAMDELRLYRRALSAEEIRELHAKPGGPVMPPQAGTDPSGIAAPPVGPPTPGSQVNGPVAIYRVTPRPPLGVTGKWHGKSVSAEVMSDTFLDITEHEDGTLTGMWGCRGVCEVKIEKGERLTAELLRWESTTPGATPWHVVARVDGKTMVIERTGGAGPSTDRKRHGNLGTSILIRD
jgi:Concanavalin A-like lectin/glucanases superfamily